MGVPTITNYNPVTKSARQPSENSQARIFGWIGGLVALAIIMISLITRSQTAPPPDSGRTREMDAVVIPKDAARSRLSLDFTWSKIGFDDIMEANFIVKNDSDYSVKDLEITCQHTANSGTKIDKQYANDL
jgi:hypothetical protein